MAVCLLITGMAFFIPFDGPGDTRRAGVVAAAIYLYMVFYSPGEGVSRFMVLYLSDVIALFVMTLLIYPFIPSSRYPSLTGTHSSVDQDYTQSQTSLNLTF